MLPEPRIADPHSDMLPLLVLIVGLLQQAPLPGPRVDRVAWLQGCWSMQSGDRTVEEQWLSPRASSMLGVGRTTRGSTLIEYEMVLIRERGTQLSYEAHPSEQDPAIFMSAAIGDRSIVFENLKHEFPQRIGYERQSADRLLAWVEGPQNGQTKRIEYPYLRVACAGD
jgi:hypothetical protein